MSRQVPSRTTDSTAKMKSRLGTFKKEDLLNIVPQKFTFRLPENFHLQSKRNVINNLILEMLKLRRTFDEIILQLDMLYMQAYPARKVWQVFKLINALEDFDRDHLSRPEAFTEYLEKNLSRSKFKCQVLSEFHEEGMWTAVQLQPIHSKGGQKKTAYKFFLLHYPGLPYILYCDIKLPIFALVQTALRLTFGNAKLKRYRLSSRNIGTVLQLVLQKEGCKFEDGPMPVIIQKQCKPISEMPLIEIPNVINEEGKDASSTTRYVNKLYGKFQQPPLESLIVRVKSEFYGNGNEEFGSVKCQVAFSGSNVLEGLRGLVQENVIKKPLHYSFEQLPQLGCNMLYLTEQ